MPRPKNTIPRFCVDAKGRAFTKVDGKFISLGRGDNPDSRTRYAALLTRLATGQPLQPEAPATSTTGVVTLNELMLQYTLKELPRFSPAEQHCQKCAIRICREMFGVVNVAEFGPLKLRKVREAMVAGDPNAKPKPRIPWCRGFVNKQIKRLRSIIRWGVSWELVPQTVADALGSVKSLGIGESSARETPARLAIPQENIDAVRGQLRQKHRDIFDLLLLTGARPGEIIGLTLGMIERTDDTWRCDLAKHKTAHRGKSRTLYFNQTAQKILERYKTAKPDEKLFKLNRTSFGNTIKAACLRAGVTPFVPHQLRHSVATKVSDDLGTESAQRLLGHSTRAMTEHYSKAAERKAVEAVKSLG